MTDQPENSASVYKKMAQVMGEINRIPKSGWNAHSKYAFATAEDVKDAVRKAMAKHSLALLVSMPEYEMETIKSSNGTGTKVRGNIVYTLACGETGQTVTSVLPMEAIDWQDKVFSKLYTLGLKYFLIDTFCISTGDEVADDPDAGEGKEIKETVKQPRKQPAKPAQAANGKAKSDPWPAKSGPVYDFCEEVKTATLPLDADCQYENQFQLCNAIGGKWPNFNDQDERDNALSLAYDHAAAKQ